MEDLFNLNRFIEAQVATIDDALNQIKIGRKTSHWMWLFFLSIKG